MQSPDKTKLLATALSLNLISPRPSVLPMLELTVKYAAVLYTKPPKAIRFQKGMSGNPSGRPSRYRRLISFRKVANEMVVVEAGSGKEIMTRWEALARMVQNLGLNKDPSAARLLHQMRKKFPGKAAPGNKWVVNDADMKL